MMAFCCRPRAPRSIRAGEPLPLVRNNGSNRNLVPILYAFVELYRPQLDIVALNNIVYQLLPTVFRMERKRWWVNTTFTSMQNVNTATQVILPFVVQLSSSHDHEALYWLVQSLSFITLFSMTIVKIQKEQHLHVNVYTLRIENEILAAMNGAAHYRKNKDEPWKRVQQLCNNVQRHYSRYQERRTQSQQAPGDKKQGQGTSSKQGSKKGGGGSMYATSGQKEYSYPLQTEEDSYRTQARARQQRDQGRRDFSALHRVRRTPALRTASTSPHSRSATAPVQTPPQMREELNGISAHALAALEVVHPKFTSRPRLRHAERSALELLPRGTDVAQVDILDPSDRRVTAESEDDDVSSGVTRVDVGAPDGSDDDQLT